MKIDDQEQCEQDWINFAIDRFFEWVCILVIFVGLPYLAFKVLGVL